MTPSRHYFYQFDSAVIPLKEAIESRRFAARAQTDFERKFHRRNMRYEAREAVRQVRRCLRERYGIA